MHDRRDTSPKNLENLHASMLGYVEQKKQGHKFTPGVKANIPDKYCPICAAVFGSAPPEVPLTAKLCGICVDKLKAGWTAHVCGNRYVFVEYSRDSVHAHCRGMIGNVTPAEMDALEREHKDQVKTKANE